MTELQHTILHGIAYFTLASWLSLVVYLLLRGFHMRRKRNKNPYLKSTYKLARRDR